MKGMVAALIALLVASAAIAGTGYSGDWWTHLSFDDKVHYLVGFLDGQTLAHRKFDSSIFHALQDPKTGQYDQNRNPGLIALQNAVQAEYKIDFNGVSPGQLIEGLNKLYADYRNLRIELADALDVVVLSISGGTDAQTEGLLEFYRKRSN